MAGPPIVSLWGAISSALIAVMRTFMAPIENVDISSPAFKANPYPFYSRLRDLAPVHRVTLGDKRPVWLVTRYEDVVTVLKDDRFVKDKRNVLTREQMAREPWIPSMLKPLEHNMLDSDAPEHTRLRGLVHMAFTPRLIENMRRGSRDLLTSYSISYSREDAWTCFATTRCHYPRPSSLKCWECRSQTAISSTVGRTPSCRPCRAGGQWSRPSQP